MDQAKKDARGKKYLDGRIRGWTRPVAWLGPTFAVVVAVPLAVLSVGSIAASASDTQTRYEQLDTALSRAGWPLQQANPVIANFPVWLAESDGVSAIALPDEAPASVLQLAHRFGSKLVVIDLPDNDRHWPAVLGDGSAAARCFEEVKLTDNYGLTPPDGSPLAHFRVFRIACP